MKKSQRDWIIGMVLVLLSGLLSITIKFIPLPRLVTALIAIMLFVIGLGFFNKLWYFNTDEQEDIFFHWKRSSNYFTTAGISTMAGGLVAILTTNVPLHIAGGIILAGAILIFTGGHFERKLYNSKEDIRIALLKKKKRK